MLPPFARHSLLSTTLIFAFLLAACLVAAAEYQTIDNGDERIHYYGPWTFKHKDDDPQGLNWQGTVSYGDIPGADCDVYFEGTRIIIYGAFFPPGEYDMKSSYSIDNGPATTYVPNPVVSKSQYRQKFYESPKLSPGRHVLKITNLGRQFWFDFAQVEVESPVQDGEDPVPGPVAPPPVTTTVTKQPVTVTTKSNPPPSPSTSQRPTTTSTSSSRSSSSSSSSSQSTTSSATQTTLSSSSSSFNTSSASSSTTSNDSSNLPVSLVGAIPTQTGSPFLPTPSDTTSLGIPIPTVVGAAGESNSHGIAVGVIAGIAVAGAFILALMVFLLLWLRRRREAADREKSIEPYAFTTDPNVTASPESTLFPFDREKFALATHLSREAPQMPPSPEQRAPPYPAADMLATPTSGTPLITPPGDRRAHAAGMDVRPNTAASKTTTYVTAGGTSSAELPSSERLGVVDTAPSAFTAPMPAYLAAAMRQSLDGGVRLAGGPPGHMVNPTGDLNRDSVYSSLPPSYQYYP